MRRGRSTGKPTSFEQRRMERIREGGCIACRMRGIGIVVPEIHHLLNTGRHGGKRLGHEFTVGLCRWHHRGESMEHMGHRYTAAELLDWLGPSLARHANRFRAEFGEDEFLLGYQDTILARVA